MPSRRAISDIAPYWSGTLLDELSSSRRGNPDRRAGARRLNCRSGPIGYPNARNRIYAEECRVKGAALMISNGKPPFDPKVFLSKVNGGRAISDYRKD